MCCFKPPSLWFLLQQPQRTNIVPTVVVVCKNHAWKRMPNKVRKSCPEEGGRIWGKSGVSEVTLGAECSNCENKPSHSPKLRLEGKKLLLELALGRWHVSGPQSCVPTPASPLPPCHAEMWSGHCESSRPMFLKLQCTFWKCSPGDVRKCRFWLSRSGGDPRFYISTKLPGDTHAGGQDHIFSIVLEPHWPK